MLKGKKIKVKADKAIILGRISEKDEAKALCILLLKDRPW